eukprot:4615935-Ditylum_brightwellii.AAC.1
MLCNLSTSVLLFSVWGAFRYLQDLHAKKKAPIDNCAMDLSVSVTFLLYTSVSTQIGSAFFAVGVGLCCGMLGTATIEVD